MNRNWLVIAVVAVAAALMIFVGVRQAKQQGSVADRAAMTGSVKGKPAPEFELKDLSGKTMKLADLRGKAVLLNFWATWCPPCKVEIPWFIELQNQYAGQGLQVIGVAMDDAKPEEIAKFANDMKINYPVLVGTDKVADAYGGVESLPTTFYIGRDGKIVDRVLGLRGHKEVEEKVKAALATSDKNATARVNVNALAVSVR